ncbi:MAG: glycosyltransferase [Candidatus Nanohaloarchaea archaeon]|nr:glycosyltransferase [Candidatus Nanohaloarchaea archaeon]
MVLLTVIWVIVALSLFMSLFWLNILYKKREEIDSYPEPENLPSISIIIPAYNEEEVIESSIRSVLDQDYPKDKIEVIVVNDGSEDSTKDIAENFLENPRFHLLNQENQGKGVAINAGREIASGEILAVQDADSVIEEEAFRKMVGCFEDSSVGGVIAGIKPLNNKTFWEHLQKVEYIIGILYRKLMALISTLYVTPGALSMYRRDLIDEVGGFDENNLTEDLEIALRLRKKGYELDMSAPAVTKTQFPQNFFSLMKQRVRWFRGMISNTFKYREMMFNREYGLFGMFQMPLNLAFPFLSLVGGIIVIYGIGELLMDFFLHLSAVGLTMPNPFEGLTVYKAIIGFNMKVYFPLIAGVFFSGLLIYLSHKLTDEGLDNPFSMAGFFIFYHIILGLFWGIALVKEISASEKRW